MKVVNYVQNDFVKKILEVVGNVLTKRSVYLSSRYVNLVEFCKNCYNILLYKIHFNTHILLHQYTFIISCTNMTTVLFTILLLMKRFATLMMTVMMVRMKLTDLVLKVFSIYWNCFDCICIILRKILKFLKLKNLKEQLEELELAVIQIVRLAIIMTWQWHTNYY